MTTLRAVITRVQLDAASEVSVQRDLFGAIPVALPVPDTLFTRVSVQDQLRRLRKRHFNLNVISIAFDARPHQTEARAQRHLNAALARTREIYDATGVTVGRILRSAVPARGGPGGDGHLRSEEELVALTNTWTVHRDGIDVFVVYRLDFDSDYEGTQPAGISPIDGPCDKDDEIGDDEMTGLAVTLENTHRQTAHTLAHEIGHYLGLEHRAATGVPGDTSGQNLMAPGATFDTLDGAQIETILDHCSIRAPLAV